MRRSERLASKQATKANSIPKTIENATPPLPPIPSIPTGSATSGPLMFPSPPTAHMSIEQIIQTLSHDPNPIFSPRTTTDLLMLHEDLTRQGVLPPLPTVSITELSAPPTPKVWSYPIAQPAPAPPPSKAKRKKNAPYPPPKPKAPKRDTNWHVIALTASASLAGAAASLSVTSPSSTVDPSQSQSSQASNSPSPDPLSINPTPAQAQATSKVIRKDIFKTYEKPPTHTKPEWAKIYTMEEMMQFPEAKVKEMDYGPHSEMGWVLARIREPNCGARGRYGWAIAEVNEPRESKYLVLSGPHVKKILFVREFDRRAYSPEAIAELKAQNEKKPSHLRDYVYDTITGDVAELAASSSAYGTTSAIQGFDAIPRGDETEFWRALNQAASLR